MPQLAKISPWLTSSCSASSSTAASPASPILAATSLIHNCFAERTVMYARDPISRFSASHSPPPMPPMSPPPPPPPPPPWVLSPAAGVASVLSFFTWR